MEVETPDSHELDRMDDATATLILQLQNNDIEELLRANKGKGRSGEASDADLAVATYQHELQERHTILSDRCMSRSLTAAVISDAALVTKSLAEENAAASDRALAHRLAGVDGPEVAVEQTKSEQALDDAFISRLVALYVSDKIEEDDTPDHVCEDDLPVAESSTWATSRQKYPDGGHRQCTICDTKTPLSRVFQTPCGHHYCSTCLHTLFEMSTTDESLFPPRCCRQQIPLSSVRLYLNSALMREFERKSVEFRTTNRTYCSQPTCSTFITTTGITGERATCTACGTRTCTICKGNAHEGDCPEDTATQQVLETAREQGWQRCYNCRRLVELDVGCNHMTYVPPPKKAVCDTLTSIQMSLQSRILVCCSPLPCDSSTDLSSYICGLRWKTCGCDQWNEDRLLARANQVIARGHVRDGAAGELQVDQAVANLRERHNCTHERWVYVRGGNQCEECYQNLPQYIFECRQCRILACNRCRRNRL